MSDRKVLNLVLLLSVVVFGVVVILYNLPRAESIPSFVKYLPTLNAVLNGTCFILLLLSYRAIRSRQIKLHKRLNLMAFALSALFLVSYILFHSFGIETRYPADAPLRPIYLFILVTHILTAAIVLPLVLLSFYHGLRGNVPSHRKVVRFSFPIWLYVTLTGVVVYLMISPYYSF
jgi:putative membrane protein